MLPLADTQFVEATWVMIVKSIVIFAVIFGILPLLTVLERKLIGRLTPAPMVKVRVVARTYRVRFARELATTVPLSC